MKWAVTALIACGVAAQAATLSVTVAGVDKAGGTLRIALFDEAHWPDNDHPLASADVPAVAPQTKVVFHDVTPGIYGVKLYLDANNNEKFDQNFIGYPLERFGFSRDARPRLSEPGFMRTRFPVGEGDTAILIHLQ